jgi:hypothetical protein
MAIGDVPASNSRIATRNKIQEIIDAINALDLGDIDLGRLEDFGDLITQLQTDVETLQTDTGVLQDRKLTQVMVAGAARATDIGITGLDVADDLIISVLRVNVEVDTGTAATGNKVTEIMDVTAEASITRAETIQLADTDTTGDTLIVTYYDADGNAA